MIGRSQQKRHWRRQPEIGRWMVAKILLFAVAFICLWNSPASAAAEKTREAIKLAEEGLGAVHIEARLRGMCVIQNSETAHAKGEHHGQRKGTR